MWGLVLIYLKKVSFGQDVSALITLMFILKVSMKWGGGILMFT